MKKILKKLTSFLSRMLTLVGLKKNNRVSEMVTNILSRIEIVDNFTERLLYILLKPLNVQDKDLKILKNILVAAIMLVVSFRHLLLDIALLLCFLMAWYKQQRSEFFRRLKNPQYMEMEEEEAYV